jgi:hypothetical protein
VDTSIIKAVEHGVLKTHMHCAKIICIRQNRCLVASVRKQILGPLFFEETITVEIYANLLTQFVAVLEENGRDCWCQQDGAIAHSTKTTTAILQDFFSNRIVRFGLWPPPCPDFTPPDIFMWRFYKERVYTNKPKSVEDLKHYNEQAVAGSDYQSLPRVAKNAVKGVNICVQEGMGLCSICCNYT